jgi:hypothetical protein
MIDPIRSGAGRTRHVTDAAGANTAGSSGEGKMQTSKFAMALLGATLASASLGASAAGSYGVVADFIDFGTADNPRADQFRIFNDSDDGSGIQILSVTIDLSLADTNLEDLFPSDSPHVPVFDTLDGCSPDYCYGEEIGYPIEAIGGAVRTGFTALTDDEQAALEESQVLTLEFGDFDPGELFTFTTDLDDLFDFRISGREFAFSTLSVTFGGGDLAGPVTLITDFVIDEEEFYRATAAASAVVPVPGALWLMLGAVGVTGARFRRRGR